jgi:hypothetical protein
MIGICVMMCLLSGTKTVAFTLVSRSISIMNQPYITVGRSVVDSLNRYFTTKSSFSKPFRSTSVDDDDEDDNDVDEVKPASSFRSTSTTSTSSKSPTGTGSASTLPGDI